MTVCIDTNVLLGFFNEEPGKIESCAPFLEQVLLRRTKAVIPVMTLLELASILTAADHHPQAEKIVNSITALPNITIAEYDTRWVLATARLKKAHKLAMADAIIVSTAIETNCDYLVTFDADFRHVSGISVLTPQEFLNLP